MADTTKREKEEQYFIELEMKKRNELRNKLDEQKKAQEKDHLKNTHWMKCPKCGHDLKEKTYVDVYIDQCDNCDGIWLDAGELELLLEGRQAKGFISKFMSSLKGKE